MAVDLLVKNATLPDGRSGIDIACAGGKITAVEPHIAAEAGRTVDASGRLVSPPFVDCHFHMDATLSLGLPRLNQSGTLLEGIALWGELKPLLTLEAVIERALSYCDLAVAQGLTGEVERNERRPPWSASATAFFTGPRLAPNARSTAPVAKPLMSGQAM